MRYNFIIRLYKDTDRAPALSDIQSITISGITLVSKPSKYGEVCLHKSNQKKYGYKISFNKRFIHAGSHNYPILAFKGEYIDIKVENFPRFPSFYQDNNAAKNCKNGWDYTGDLNKGFPHQLLYRKIEILSI